MPDTFLLPRVGLLPNPDNHPLPFIDPGILFHPYHSQDPAPNVLASTSPRDLATFTHRDASCQDMLNPQALGRQVMDGLAGNCHTHTHTHIHTHGGFVTRKEVQRLSQGNTPKGSGTLTATWDLLPHLTKEKLRPREKSTCTRAPSQPPGERLPGAVE